MILETNCLCVKPLCFFSVLDKRAHSIFADFREKNS